VPEERLQKVLAAAGSPPAARARCSSSRGGSPSTARWPSSGRRWTAPATWSRSTVSASTSTPTGSTSCSTSPRGWSRPPRTPRGGPTVVDLINLPQRLFPIGRLDMDTEGLLLLSNDGELTNALLHPSREVERWYVALVTGPVKPRMLSALREGVELEDGIARPSGDPARGGQGQGAARGRDDRGPQARGAPHARRGRAPGRAARPRAFADVELGELRQGKWRFLTQAEIGALHDAARAGEARAARSSRERAAATHDARGAREPARAGESQPRGRGGDGEGRRR
jgi:23S rRNA pseudouridine2605 synthase